MSMGTNRIEAYRSSGYVAGLPVFSNQEMDALNADLVQILNLLGPGESTKEIREWHETSRYLFDICMNDRILNYVEAFLGPDFFLWASNFFVKDPNSTETVGWHQDAYYWPLTPVESATVWLAFDDVDDENGAMGVLAGSHEGGLVAHNRVVSDSVLGIQADVSGFDVESVERVHLKRGEISIHNDKLLHSSPANLSNRRRAGFTIRYSPNRVRCDLSVNPHFKIYQARGVRCAHNPHGSVPEERFGRLHRDHRSIEEVGEKEEGAFWNK